MLKVIILKKLEVVRKDTGLAVRWQEGHQNQMMDEVLANLCSKCFFSFVRSPLGNSYLTSTPSTHTLTALLRVFLGSATSHLILQQLPR